MRLSPAVYSHIAAATIGLVLAALVVSHARGGKEIEPRHHIYWCHMVVHQQWEGYRFTHTLSLPCMYRTNDPVSV